MRGQRSAKFAEYVSTYAILKRLGLHDTVLIEKRDASVGYGVFVRDSCDAGTPLLVVPSRRACAGTTLERLGANLLTADCSDAAGVAALDGGVLSALLGCGARVWGTFAWRLAIERQRGLSPWWGWLGALPGPEAFAALADNCERHCRLHHPSLLPHLVDARRRIDEEVSAMHALLAGNNVAPSPAFFRGAVDVVMSRAQFLPLCWKNAASEPIELGILPFVDLINGHDGADRKRNATVEVAFAFEELPDWYCSWFVHESELRGINGMKELHRLMEEHFFALVVLDRHLTASEEVILDYELLPLPTRSALTPEEELLLGRLLRYFF